VRCDRDCLLVNDWRWDKTVFLCFLLPSLIILPVISIVPLFRSVSNQASALFVRCVLCAVLGCLGAPWLRVLCVGGVFGRASGIDDWPLKQKGVKGMWGTGLAS
jgi:hypothetical protein